MEQESRNDDKVLEYSLDSEEEDFSLNLNLPVTFSQPSDKSSANSEEKKNTSKNKTQTENFQEKKYFSLILLQTILETFSNQLNRKLKALKFNYFQRWKETNYFDQTNIQLKNQLLLLFSALTRYHRKRKTKFLAIWKDFNKQSNIKDSMEKSNQALEKQYKSHLDKLTEELKQLEQKQEEVESQVSNMLEKEKKYKSTIKHLQNKVDEYSQAIYQVDQKFSGKTSELHQEVKRLKNELQHKEQQVIDYFDDLSSILLNSTNFKKKETKPSNRISTVKN